MKFNPSLSSRAFEMKNWTPEKSKITAGFIDKWSLHFSLKWWVFAGLWVFFSSIAWWHLVWTRPSRLVTPLPFSIIAVVRSFSLWLIGSRKINQWTCGGDATINEFFVRLTPDRQSKSGFCWSKSTLSSGEWVTTIKFRISGQVRLC